MKPLRIIALLVLSIMILVNTSSCIVLVKESSPQHKGWLKNSNNPHHPHSTNPGKSKGNHSEKKHS